MNRFRAVVLLLLTLAFAGTSSAQSEGEVFSAANLRRDLAYLYETLQEAHYDLFAHRSRGEYDAFYERTSASIVTPMSRPDVVRLFQRFMAFGRVGHARLDAGMAEFRKYAGEGGMVLPLFLRVADGRVFLSRAPDLDGRLIPGTEILEVDGQPALSWLDTIGEVVSAERSYMMYAQLEQVLPVAAWLALGPRDAVSVVARDGSGSTFRANISALSYAEFRLLSKLRPPNSGGTDFNAREVRILGEGVAYLRPGPFFNTGQSSGGPAPSYDESSFRTFLDQAFRQVIDAGTRDLVIDLRNNPGGDNSFSDPMIAWFADKPFRFASRFMLKASGATKAWYAKQDTSQPGIVADLAAAEAKQPNGSRYEFDMPLVQPRTDKRFTGRVYVLVNRHSYSNAATTAATIEDYGFGTIVGEETADLPTTYASVLYFDLPNSAITVTYPKSYIVRPNGSEAVRGVVPRYRISEPAAPSRTDTVLEQTVALVKKLRR